jgi:hypothetical protein
MPIYLTTGDKCAIFFEDIATRPVRSGFWNEIHNSIHIEAGARPEMHDDELSDPVKIDNNEADT